MTKELASIIEAFEGRVSRPYTDSNGYTTIGVGRCLDTKPLKDHEIEYLFHGDLMDAWDAARQGVGREAWAGLTVPRIYALVVMCFQLGSLRDWPRMVADIRSGDYGGAAWEMLHGTVEGQMAPVDSAWRRQTPARCEWCAETMRTGELQPLP